MDIVNYIEKIGMTFGADLNAYTSFDETVYQLTVPTDKPDVMLKGLDILRDWAGDVSFDPDEVDKERGVVLEEWRLGRGAFARIEDKQFPVIFQGSKYAERLPIGLPEIIKTAKRDTLYRFYKDWYRPDNMAVIAVGDFDPADDRERRSRRGSATSSNPAKERQRVAVPVPHDQPTRGDDRDRSRDAVHARRRSTTSSITVRDATQGRLPALPRRERCITRMLNARFSELARRSRRRRSCRPAPVRGPFVAHGRCVHALGGRRRRGARERHARRCCSTRSSASRSYGFLATELERARGEHASRASRPRRANGTRRP